LQKNFHPDGRKNVLDACAKRLLGAIKRSNAWCRTMLNIAVCSCWATFIGKTPVCPCFKEMILTELEVLRRIILFDVLKNNIIHIFFKRLVIEWTHYIIYLRVIIFWDNFRFSVRKVRQRSVLRSESRKSVHPEIRKGIGFYETRTAWLLF